MAARKAFVLCLVIILFGQACAQSAEVLSVEEAEQQYVGDLFALGVPNAGVLRNDPSNPDLWAELEMVWYDSLEESFVWHHYLRNEGSVKYRTAPSDSSKFMALRKEGETIKNQGRNLNLPTQQDHFFLPVTFEGISFNRLLRPGLKIEGWTEIECKRPNQYRFCYQKGSWSALLAIGNRHQPRPWKISIKGLSEEEAVQGLLEFSKSLQVEPDIINWTTFAKKPMLHGYSIGDLFTLSAYFQSTYPAFRVNYYYKALGGELEIKLSNTRPDYGLKPKRKKLCVFGSGSKYACEFIGLKDLQGKLTN